MPRPKPSAIAGTAELNTMIARTAPAILELLADGVPRTKPAIVEALAGRHDRQDVVHALIRLAVTGRGGGDGRPNLSLIFNHLTLSTKLVDYGRDFISYLRCWALNRH